VASEASGNGELVCDDILQILDRKSGALEDLLDNFFKALRQSEMPNIFCFYEEEPSNIMILVNGAPKKMVSLVR
jgi:hypothetical protein